MVSLQTSASSVHSRGALWTRHLPSRQHCANAILGSYTSPRSTDSRILQAYFRRSHGTATDAMFTGMVW